MDSLYYIVNNHPIILFLSIVIVSCMVLATMLWDFINPFDLEAVLEEDFGSSEIHEFLNEGWFPKKGERYRIYYSRQTCKVYSWVMDDDGVFKYKQLAVIGDEDTVSWYYDTFHEKYFVKSFNGYWVEE